MKDSQPLTESFAMNKTTTGVFLISNAVYESNAVYDLNCTYLRL